MYAYIACSASVHAVEKKLIEVKNGAYTYFTVIIKSRFDSQAFLVIQLDCCERLDISSDCSLYRSNENIDGSVPH